MSLDSSAGTTSPTARDEFWYGPDGSRFLKRESWDDDSTQQQSLTVYLYGGVYEEVHPLHDGDTDWHRKIQASSAALIRVTQPAGQSTTETIEYLHRDHLGSVHKVTDGQGNTLHDLAFDPFGGRRESDWSGDIDLTSLEAILDDLGKNTARGFTDHEHLDRTGFIHMNGRVYDPRIGRFVQPDPLVLDPTFSQNYNPYAYVRNSPLSLTDPSGFSPDGPPKLNMWGIDGGFAGAGMQGPFSSGGVGLYGGVSPWGAMGAGTSGFNWFDINAAIASFLAGLEGGGSGASLGDDSSATGGGGTTPGTAVPDTVVDGGGGTGSGGGASDGGGFIPGHSGHPENLHVRETGGIVFENPRWRVGLFAALKLGLFSLDLGVCAIEVR